MKDSAKNQSVLEFEVHDGGTLTVANFVEPSTRAEYYEDVADRWADSPQDLFDAMSECEPLAWAVQSIYSDLRGDLESVLHDAESRSTTNKLRITALKKRLADLTDESEVGAIDWLLSLTDDEFESLVVPVINRWFKDEPNWSYEDGYLPLGLTAQGAALNFFKDMESELLDAIGVAIVEGDHPGSTYFAAELRMSVIDSNAEAEKRHLGIKFVLVHD